MLSHLPSFRAGEIRIRAAVSWAQETPSVQTSSMGRLNLYWPQPWSPGPGVPKPVPWKGTELRVQPITSKPTRV